MKGPERPGRCSLANSGDVNNGERGCGGESWSRFGFHEEGTRLPTTGRPWRDEWVNKQKYPLAPRSLICKPNKKNKRPDMPLKV